MKKHINVILCLIIYCVIFCPFDVKAYTTGPVKGPLITDSTNKGTINVTGNTGTTIGQADFYVPYRITCNTNYCFFSFALTQAYQNGQVTLNEHSRTTYTQVSNGNYWFQCETGDGLSLCMVPNNSTIYKIQVMANMNTYTSAYFMFDCSTVDIFDSPSNVDIQLQNIQQSQNQNFNAVIQQQQNQNQIINNTDTSGNSTDFNNTINNSSLPNTSHGFDILGSLQGLINGINVSGSCNRVSVPIPFVNKTLTLPCMTTDVYSVHFPEVVVIWQLIVRGLGYYYILVNILKLIKETIDPFNFKLEVLDL